MNTIFKTSPMLDAVDLPRVNLEAMQLDELEEHADQVRDTILGLMDSILRAGHMSAIAAANVRNLEMKLRLHLARLSDLIQARKLAEMIQADSLQDESEIFGKNAKYSRP